MMDVQVESGLSKSILSLVAYPHVADKDDSDVSECFTQLGLSELNVQCCIGDKYKQSPINKGGQKTPKPKGPADSNNSTSPVSTEPYHPPLGQDDRAARGAFLPPDQFPNGFVTGG